MTFFIWAMSVRFGIGGERDVIIRNANASS